MCYKYIVGFSGGPDSVALVHWLHSQGHPLLVTHCNFHLRGEESDRDEAFCRQFCAQLGLPLLVKHFDTRQFMADAHLSLETAARQLRYEWWHTLLAEHPEAQLAIGHHRDDSIETLLFNLMRGTGIKGLTGIPAQNGRITRPLLSWSRADVMAYLSTHHLSYITDSSNLELDATRNKIRHQLLPLMEQILPQARHGIAHSIELLQHTRLLAEAQLDAIFSRTQTFSRAGITWHEFVYDPECGLPLSFLFHEWSQRYPAHTCRQHGNLFYTHVPVPPHSTLLTPNSSLLTPNSSLTSNLSTLTSPSSALFDADLVTLPLTVRHWREGDRIAPLGMQGHERLVSNIFSDAHLTPMHKATTWIVTDATGRLLWVVGHKVSHHTRITPQTQRVMQLDASMFE